MFDTKPDLMEAIRLGEDGFLELKEVRVAGDRVTAPSRESLADEMAAFANSQGGVCVLGVEDRERTVQGIALENLDRVEAFAREVCNDSIKPPLAAAIQRMTLPSPLGKELAVIRVEIRRSLFVHQSPGGYFLRIGSSKREMTTEYLARLLQQRSQARIIRFDEQTIPGAAMADLDEALWRRFETKWTKDEAPEVFLNKLGLARRDEEGLWRPTVSGALMASEDPRQFSPNWFIQAVAYRGTSATPEQGDRGYQVDAADISGPLDKQVEEAVHFVAKNMRVHAKKDLGRVDIPDYDLTAVFEAVVNAVAHRDYGVYGSKIRLRMFADRLELYSPGALANTMTVESLSLRQSARNEVLTSLLARCPVPAERLGLQSERRTMMDKRGEGVRIILERTEELTGLKPEYRVLDGEEVMLTIPAVRM